MYIALSGLFLCLALKGRSFRGFLFNQIRGYPSHQCDRVSASDEIRVLWASPIVNVYRPFRAFFMFSPERAKSVNTAAKSCDSEV